MRKLIQIDFNLKIRISAENKVIINFMVYFLNFYLVTVGMNHWMCHWIEKKSDLQKLKLECITSLVSKFIIIWMEFQNF
jgi:hypothetical protein